MPTPTDPEPDDEVQFTLRLPRDLHETIKAKTQLFNRSMSWYIRGVLEAQRQRELKPATGPLLDDQWKIVENAGMSGHTYEVTVSFGLPPVEGRDEIAADVRDALIATVVGKGARDPVTRLISLCGMHDPKEVDTMRSPQTEGAT